MSENSGNPLAGIARLFGRAEKPDETASAPLNIEPETSTNEPSATDESAIRESERQRVMAIVSSPEAVGRMASAIALACTTDMSAEQVGAVLATVPKQAEPSASYAEAFDRHMQSAGNPDIAPDASVDGGTKPDLVANMKQKISSGKGR